MLRKASGPEEQVAKEVSKKIDEVSDCLAEKRVRFSLIICVHILNSLAELICQSDGGAREVQRRDSQADKTQGRVGPIGSLPLLNSLEMICLL